MNLENEDKLQKNKLYTSAERKQKLPSEVIKDAKNWCALRAINTKRPTTPLDPRRSLFGGESTSDRSPLSRPPSSYSTGFQKYETSESTTNSFSNLQHSRPSKLLPLKMTALVAVDTKKKTQNQISNKYFSSKGSQNALNKNQIQKMSALPEKKISPKLKLQHVYTDTKAKSLVNKLENKTNKKASSNTSSSFQNVSSSFNISSDTDEKSPVIKDPELSETKSQALYWNTTVLPILEKIEDFTNTESNSLCVTCRQLQAALNEVNLKQLMNRRRTSLLSALFRLLNVQQNELNLTCADIIFKVGVNNKNLTSICKIIFKISRDRSNDNFFLTSKILSSLLKVLCETEMEDVNEKYEALVYLCGSLKFISENKKIVGLLHSLDFIQVLLKMIQDLTLSAVNCKNTGNKKFLKQILDILVQITEALRNMLEIGDFEHISSTALSTLLNCMELFALDTKLNWIISRVFSKLTVSESVVKNLVTCPQWTNVLMSSLRNHLTNEKIVIRLLFVFGNILANNNFARELLFNFTDSNECSNWSVYSLTTEVIKSQLHGILNKEVVIKGLRVIANMSMNGDVGVRISNDSEMLKSLMQIITCHIDDEECSKGKEMVTNCIIALNNLVFYNNDIVNTKTSVFLLRIELTTIVTKLLTCENMLSYVTEVARVLGNLTKYQDVRDFVHKHKVDLIMTTLLDSGDHALVYNSCGVLINISGDLNKRHVLIKEGIVVKICDVLQDFAMHDWQLCGLCCQLMWNLLSGDSDFNVQYSFLLQTLQDLTDISFMENKTSLNESSPEHCTNFLDEWENEFLCFAQPLVNKLQNLGVNTSCSQLIPVEANDK